MGFQQVVGVCDSVYMCLFFVDIVNMHQCEIDPNVRYCQSKNAFAIEQIDKFRVFLKNNQDNTI